MENQEGRKVYEHHEDLEPHFAGSVSDLPYLEQNKAGKAIASFANLLKLHGPLVITDEAHNANTPLSYQVYERLGAKVVVELTATPEASKSNVLVSVSAFELKGADMIKFPVVLKEHVGQWEVAVGSAVARNELGKTALGEPDYIRPILLIQAENAKGTATVEEVKKHLIDNEKVPKAIAIATGDQREIDGVDLFARIAPSRSSSPSKRSGRVGLLLCLPSSARWPRSSDRTSSSCWAACCACRMPPAASRRS